ncbi:hypothetical protein BDV34DRAFT_189951 [Aspergillus parasiticus]|uniref:Uncharacterized protein n=1 Tax=Aspergillus parasiticus TaxID=5067 RepID=A0A5N6DU38_ASPPA|nr:hypothetical protein BDV34DRAFT_189951 [Aspergillus parasiticus]
MGFLLASFLSIFLCVFLSVPPLINIILDAARREITVYIRFGLGVSRDFSSALRGSVLVLLWWIVDLGSFVWVSCS